MKRKWTLFWFMTGDFKAVEHYLNEQAEKGWELEKVGMFARWKRTERTDLTYCVDLLNPDHSETEPYVAVCAEAGWEKVRIFHKMCIFKSMPGREVVPVHTDPELEWKNYKRCYLYGTMALLIWLVVCYARDFWYLLQNRSQPLKEGSSQAVMVIYALILLWRIADFIRAMVNNRGGRIGESPRWVMWANCVTRVVLLAAITISVIVAVCKVL